jgi:hypothetical protein
MSESTVVSDLAGIVAAAKMLERDFDNDAPWWRGHADADWLLQAQAHRPNPKDANKPYDEAALLVHFISRAPSRSHRPCPAANEHFSWLFLAQHYGLPIRLLDWSESAMVAAYFAVTDLPDRDGCIWALSPGHLNKRFGGHRHIAESEARHSKSLQRTLSTVGANRT